jgi:hypothetical protein
LSAMSDAEFLASPQPAPVIRIPGSSSTVDVRIIDRSDMVDLAMD